jgi:hypothetical protein
MRRLIASMLSGCWHQWECVTRVRVEDKGRYVADDFILRCTKCGEMTRRRL